MSKMIQGIVLAVSVALVAATVWAAPDAAKVERDKNATQVAKAWFTSLMQGETAVTTSLSAVPFSFDRKHEVKTLLELKELYDQIVNKKGKRDLKATSVKVNTSSPEKVEVVLMIEDEGVAVTVRPGEAFRVIGFSD
jgi:hypothetical protein